MIDGHLGELMPDQPWYVCDWFQGFSDDSDDGLVEELEALLRCQALPVVEDAAMMRYYRKGLTLEDMHR